MKAWKFILGFVLIAVAVVLILEAVGVISPITSFLGEINFWQALGGIALVGSIIMVLSWKQFWMIFVPLGFLFMIFERNIAHVCGGGEDLINNWLVFGCSILLSLGFLFLIPKKRKIKHKFHGYSRGKSYVKGNRMGATSMYIDCDEFGRTEMEKYIENNLGAIEIHFENPENYAGGGILHLDNKLGAVEIHVPKNWEVRCEDVDLTLGVIDWNKNNENGPLLIIEGKVELGAVDVSRV